MSDPLIAVEPGAREPSRSNVLRRHRRIVVLGTGVALLLFVAASVVMFVWPPTDAPTHADAILSLNGRNEPARESLAISLAERGYARVLLFSQGHSGTTRCPQVPRVHVVCFEANPSRTVAEVEFAAKYLEARGWRSLIVVPGRAQSIRTRLLMSRCFSGSITIVAAPVKSSQLVYEVAYEWGALGKALFVDRHC